MTDTMMDKLRAFQRELDRLIGRYPIEPEPGEADGDLSDEFAEAVARSAEPPEDPVAYRDECEDMGK